MMTPLERCESVSGKYLYAVFCLDRLEKTGLMDLFLMVTASGSNSTMMALNGPNFSLDSLDDDLFRIG